MNTGARTAVTCGNAGGVVTTDDELLFDLQAIEGDIAGVVWLRYNADGTSSVVLFVTQGLATGGYRALHARIPEGTPLESGDGEGTPLSAGAEEAGAPTEVTVASHDIYFEPNEFTEHATTDV